ncbi:MAG: D-proline reductase (dithiol) proprotein PrdA, partial [Terrisporobacter sp.]
MSITADTAKQHANDPAVLCCRAEEGTVIGPANLEDPEIFDELVDSGLLNLEGCLTIGQILGTKLTKTCDALTPVTLDVIDGVVENKEDVEKQTQVETSTIQGGKLKIHIGEGKDINIEIPIGGLSLNTQAQVVPVNEKTLSYAKEVIKEAKVVRSLTRKHYKITAVKRGPETKIEGTVLYIREGIESEAIESQNLVNSLKIDIITPDKYNTYSETIMDVQPIATKEGEDELGSGTTRVLDGVVMMVTGTDTNGVQIGEFGSSE